MSERNRPWQLHLYGVSCLINVKQIATDRVDKAVREDSGL
jgi:hypothetical protein